MGFLLFPLSFNSKSPLFSIHCLRKTYIFSILFHEANKAYFLIFLCCKRYISIFSIFHRITSISHMFMTVRGCGGAQQTQSWVSKKILIYCEASLHGVKHPHLQTECSHDRIHKHSYALKLACTASRIGGLGRAQPPFCKQNARMMGVKKRRI